MSSGSDSGLWDIAQYVEGHPDNHDQRWRLAKKLYMSWEYRLALEHLLVLKNEWSNRVNVHRYLAATYYRLSRYDEAIRELDHAIGAWPAEVGLREQHAKALDKAGRGLDAADAWAVVADMNPSHPFAGKAARKLRDKELGREEKATEEKLSALDLNGVFSEPEQIVCSRCGMKNGIDFDRCWSCHAPLTRRGSATPGATSRTEPSPATPILVGVGIVGLLSLGVYLTLKQLTATPENSAILPQSLAIIVKNELLQTRIIVGIAALVAWPIALRLASVIAGVQDANPNRAHVSGVALAALTYATVWWPSSYIYLALCIPIAASAAVVIGILGRRSTEAALVWAVQAGIMLLVVATAFVAIHGFGLLTEFNAINRAATKSDAPPPAETAGATPHEATLILVSSGSSWLDERAGQVRLTVHPESLENRMFIEVLDGKTTLTFTRVTEAPFNLTLDGLDAAHPYTLRLTSEGKATTGVAIDATSLLAPTFHTKSTSPRPLPPS